MADLTPEAEAREVAEKLLDKFQRELETDAVREYPILHLADEGYFYVSYKGEVSEPNSVYGKWTEILRSGDFYIIPVSGTIDVDLSPYHF